MPSRDKLAEFIARCAKHITTDEKGEVRLFPGPLVQACGQVGSLDIGGHPEFCIHQDKEDGGWRVLHRTLELPDAKKLVAEDCIPPASKEEP